MDIFNPDSGRWRGGCACGEVRYDIRGEPLMSLHCQCRQCQRVTGAGHASQFGVRSDAVDMHGTLTLYEMTADSGHRVSSGFCPRCGSPVLKKSAGHPTLLFFHAATLDDPALFSPQRVVWSASKQPWDHVDPALPID